MKLPNAAAAIIDQAKVQQYLLNLLHPDGGPKARLLHSLGYHPDAWQKLVDDIRAMHLSEDVVEVRQTEWGVRYEIVAPITGPSGDAFLFRSIWQIDLAAESPRLITMHPE